jgi:hypothetical protein
LQHSLSKGKKDHDEALSDGFSPLHKSSTAVAAARESKPEGGSSVQRISVDANLPVVLRIFKTTKFLVISRKAWKDGTVRSGAQYAEERVL